MAEANVNKEAGKIKRMEICGHCQSRVEEGICCDCCKFWVHFKCEGVSEAEARVWDKMSKRAKFYCSVRNCEQIAEQFINSIGPLKDQVENNTRMIADLELKIASQESNIRKDMDIEINRAINIMNGALEVKQDKIKSEVMKEVEGVLGTQGDKDAVPGAAVDKGQVKMEVQVVLDEEKDRTFRARNLILAGVPEPDTDDLGVGKAADLEYVTDLFASHMKVDSGEYKIMDTTRLYRGKNAAGNIRIPRLLRVQFDRENMVGKVARAAPKLDSSEEPIVKAIKIFRDRTKRERDERKKLLSQAEDKNNEESDNAFKWIVDFEKKDVIRVTKGGQYPKTFRQRRYR